MTALDDLLDIDVYDALDQVATRVARVVSEAVQEVSRTVVRAARAFAVAACLASVLMPIQDVPPIAMPPPAEVAVAVGDSDSGTVWEGSGLISPMTLGGCAMPTARSLGLRSFGPLDRPLIDAQVRLAQAIAARGAADPLALEAQKLLDAAKADYVNAVRALPPSKIDRDLDAALAALEALEEETSADDSSSPGSSAAPSATEKAEKA